jgi:hypothetical protein
MPLFFTFIFLSYDMLQDMTGSHHTVFFIYDAGVMSGTGGIIRIPSHSCDELGQAGFKWWS